MCNNTQQKCEGIYIKLFNTKNSLSEQDYLEFIKIKFDFDNYFILIIIVYLQDFIQGKHY